MHLILGRRSIEERSLVYFSDNPTHLLEAYVDSGEGLDRAGGFAIQVFIYIMRYIVSYLIANSA